MAMDLKEIENYIKEALPNASIEIQDLAGDGNHYSATITCSDFAGKSKTAVAVGTAVVVAAPLLLIKGKPAIIEKGTVFNALVVGDKKIKVE